MLLVGSVTCRERGSGGVGRVRGERALARNPCECRMYVGVVWPGVLDAVMREELV